MVLEWVVGTVVKFCGVHVTFRVIRETWTTDGLGGSGVDGGLEENTEKSSLRKATLKISNLT